MSSFGPSPVVVAVALVPLVGLALLLAFPRQVARAVAEVVVPVWSCWTWLCVVRARWRVFWFVWRVPRARDLLLRAFRWWVLACWFTPFSRFGVWGLAVAAYPRWWRVAWRHGPARVFRLLVRSLSSPRG